MDRKSWYFLCHPMIRLIYLYRATDIIIISRNISCPAPIVSVSAWNREVDIDWRYQWSCVIFVIVSRRTWTRKRQFIIFANLFKESLRKKKNFLHYIFVFSRIVGWHLTRSYVQFFLDKICDWRWYKRVCFDDVEEVGRTSSFVVFDVLSEQKMKDSSSQFKGKSHTSINIFMPIFLSFWTKTFLTEKFVIPFRIVLISSRLRS